MGKKNKPPRPSKGVWVWDGSGWTHKGGGCLSMVLFGAFVVTVFLTTGIVVLL